MMIKLLTQGKQSKRVTCTSILHVHQELNTCRIVVMF